MRAIKRLLCHILVAYALTCVNCFANYDLCPALLLTSRFQQLNPQPKCKFGVKSMFNAKSICVVQPKNFVITLSSQILPSSPSRVQIVIPVLNEERCLRSSISRLSTFLSESMPKNYSFFITIADNGSTDSTAVIGKQLAAERSDLVSFTQLPMRGRGRALKEAWLALPADIHCYMDVDLSTNLSDFPSILNLVARKHPICAPFA